MLNFKSRIAAAPAAPEYIRINGRDYALHIRRHARSRSITLRTDPARETIRVTSPPYVPVHQITAFVHEKSDWIENSFAKAGPVSRLEADSIIAFRGEQAIIRWQEEWPRRVIWANGEIRVGGPCQNVPKRVAAWLKKQARQIMADDIAYYSSAAGIMPPPLALSSARRRWGSCSSAGKVRINWRLIMAPDDVRRSVVAHEIAHMQHMDHSAAFYAWLDHIYEGDRNAADRWLKEHGATLHAVVIE